LAVDRQKAVEINSTLFFKVLVLIKE